jgi:hypothetical protein
MPMGTYRLGVIEDAGQPYKQLFKPAMLWMPSKEVAPNHFPINRDGFFRKNGHPDLTREKCNQTDRIAQAESKA